jgi:FMN-dependent NADH-azoreductase
VNTLLKIKSSINGDNGDSSRLVDHFGDRWLAANPGGRVLTRDLTASPPPHLDAERFGAFLTPSDQRTPAQNDLARDSDTLIQEVLSADEIVLGVPMYNFSVPSTLRAYFDHIARAGVTFRYTESGPVGLATGKRAHLVVTRGGAYDEDADTQIPYLRQFLGFIGITDASVIRVEGLAMGDESRRHSIDQARNRIDVLAMPKPIPRNAGTEVSAGAGAFH